MARCPLCGFGAGEGDPFCPLCGASMAAGGQAAVEAPSRRGFVELPGGERVEVTGAPAAIGREQLRPYAGAEAVHLISRAHFTVSRVEGRFMIEDGPTPAQPKRSANGTWVRRAGGAEVRVSEGGPVALEGGEAIDVARVVALRFTVEGA